jgi:hypothetical protein
MPRNNPFAGSEVWEDLPRTTRRKILGQLRPPERWLTFRIPAQVTAEQLQEFGRKNLLRSAYSPGPRFSI